MIRHLKIQLQYLTPTSYHTKISHAGWSSMYARSGHKIKEREVHDHANEVKSVFYTIIIFWLSKFVLILWYYLNMVCYLITCICIQIYIIFSFLKFLYTIQQENMEIWETLCTQQAKISCKAIIFVSQEAGYIQQYITLVNSAQITVFGKLNIMLNEKVLPSTPCLGDAAASPACTTALYYG